MARVLAEATGADRARIWLRVREELRLGAAWPEQLDAIRVRLDGGGVPSGIDDYASEVRHQGELLGRIAIAMPAEREPRFFQPGRSSWPTSLRKPDWCCATTALIESPGVASATRRRPGRGTSTDRAEHPRRGAATAGRACREAERLADALVGKDEERDATRSLWLFSGAARRDPKPGPGRSPGPGSRDLSAAARRQGTRPRRSVAQAAQVARCPDRGPTRTASAGSPQAVEAGRSTSACLEALQNVAKYAKAERAEIRLFASDDALTFVVEDNGMGFDPAITSGSGLSNMRDRLEALGGELDVRSSVGRGTSVTGTVPIPGPQRAAVSAHRRQLLPEPALRRSLAR